MLLSTLLSSLGHTSCAFDCPVFRVTDRLDAADSQSIFVALRGRKTDGHKFVPDALTNGAVCAVSPDSGLLSLDRCFGVEDGAAFLSLANRLLAGRPDERLKIVAVTGTSGKSSTAHLLWQILQKSGKKAGLVGTVFTFDGLCCRSTARTTPEAQELWPLLQKMAENGCEYCVMEASSQALAQKRLEGIRPVLSIYTNFSQDHLDYHGSLSAYYAAKCRLIPVSKQLLFGLDSPALLALTKSLSLSHKTFSLAQKADYTAKIFCVSESGISLGLQSPWEADLTLPLFGSFSAQNVLAALGGAHMLGLSHEEITNALAHCLPLEGRGEWIGAQAGFRVMRDFAHTPNALEAILSSLKDICEGRLILVFGCGGERDREKRPLMAKIAAKYADRIYLTDDNPRKEDPLQIINELLPPLQESGADFRVLRPREAAIRAAAMEGERGDILLLAGKGHETTQETGGICQALDEKKLIMEIFLEQRTTRR